MSAERTDLDPRIKAYYDRRSEESRLSGGAGQLEALRTREIFTRYAPAPPAVVYDVGGAAGAYAIELAKEGYAVHLLDPVARLVDVARAKSASSSDPLQSAQVGDARSLPFADETADIVLLLGPLYHLQDAEDRAVALSEAARVLRPGGFLFAACITRWASLLDGVARGFLADPQFAANVEEDLKTGRHENPAGELQYFTTAYFHKPEDFTAELQMTRLSLRGVFGLEGPARAFVDFEERWADPTRREHLVRLARALESEPSVLGISSHLLGVCQKPNNVQC